MHEQLIIKLKHFTSESETLLDGLPVVIFPTLLRCIVTLTGDFGLLQLQLHATIHLLHCDRNVAVVTGMPRFLAPPHGHIFILHQLCVGAGDIAREKREVLARAGVLFGLGPGPDGYHLGGGKGVVEVSALAPKLFRHFQFFGADPGAGFLSWFGFCYDHLLELTLHLGVFLLLVWFLRVVLGRNLKNKNYLTY